MATVYIVGIGGRTGALFGRELQGASNVVGVGMEREVTAVKNGKIKIQRGGGFAAIFNVHAILAQDFGRAIESDYPDFIWLAVRNPVAEAVKFYYRHFAGKDKFPALILSQNGLSVIDDAKAGLRAALGQGADKVRIIRVSLINGVDLPAADIALPSGSREHRDVEPEGQRDALPKADNVGSGTISYKLPIKLGFGAINGQSSDFKNILFASQIKAQEFRGSNVVDMENSKLFTNLIGMASAVNEMDAGEGLRDKKIFRQEVAMLKEFILAIKKSGGGFVDDFCGYPVKFLAQMMLWPIWLLLPWRGVLANIVAKGRNRPKDLSEIDYYNGEVVKLGKKFNVLTPVNEGIVAKAKAVGR